MPEHDTVVSCIPIFADNYVWVIHGTTYHRRVAVVDPGDGTAVRDFLDDGDYELRAILITHHHGDHTGGVAVLAGAYGAPVYGPTRDSYGGVVHAVFEHQSLEIAGLDLSIKVMEVPGHTADHVAYATHDSVFCGDALFSAGCGRIIEGNPAQMWRSLRRLALLPPHTRVYCAHEYTLANLRFAAAVEPENPEIIHYREDCNSALRIQRRTVPSTLARELRVNPFLRCEIPAVRLAAERIAGRRLDDAAEVFSILRRWKDEFKPADGPGEGTL